MKPRTRLLFFVILPLVTAAGVVTWVSRRLAPAPTVARRTLPATTQVVAGRAGLAWKQPGLSWRWGTIGFIDPSNWYGASVQPVPPANTRATAAAAYTRFQFQAVAGDLKGGLMHTGTTLKQAITGPGVDAAGLLYVPTDASDVTAIDLVTQRPIWSVAVGGPTAHLAVTANRLAASTADHVTCIDATTGSTLWSARVPEGITTAPGLTDRFACYATADALHVLDAATGRELHKLPASGLSGRIAIDGQRAYACTEDDPRSELVALYAFDLPSGSIAWKWEEAGATRTNFRPQGPADVRGPAVGSGTVVFTLGERLCAVDAATGRRRWVWRPDPAEYPTPDSVRQTLLYAATITGTPAIIDGVVYATWQGNRVSGWDAASGREVWRYEGPDVRLTPPPDIPPLARDGLLLCVTGGEGLCALRCDLIPKAPPPPSSITPAAQAIHVPWAVGTASSLLLVAIILAVFGLWRFMFSLACLLLCILTVFAWVRSYVAAEFVGRQALTNNRPFVAQDRRGVISRNGTLTFGRTHDVFQSTIRRPVAAPATPLNLCWTREPVARSADDSPTSNLLRFAWTHHSRPSGTSFGEQAETSLTLPHWFVAAVLAIGPLAWLSGVWRDRRRYAAGLCPWCGYDLRESKGRCPECGRAIAAARKRT